MKRYGMMLTCGVSCFLVSSMAFAQPARIISAVYGTPEAMRTCNAGPAVASMCAGQQSCSVPIGNTLCGDPNFLVAKRIDITYSCGRRMQQTTAPENAIARIACQ